MKKSIVIDGKHNPNYSVDHNGNVFNKEGQKMTPSYTHDGYQRVRLQRGLPRKMYRVHRIVCESFYGLNTEKPVVNHINGVRDDNRLENLEWCTIQHNNKIVPLDKRNLKPEIEVAQYTSDGELISVYKSIAEASRLTGVPSHSISRVCKGVTRITRGFQWKYYERPENIEKTSH